MRTLTPFLAVALLSASSASTARAELRPPGSTVAVDPLGRGTWVVDQERDEVALISSTADVRRYSVGAWPEQLAVADDGTVFVSCRQDGRIDVINGDTTRSIPVGAEPRAIVLDDAGENLYVALVTEHAVARVDAKKMLLMQKRHVDMDPWAMALTPAGLAVAGSKNDSIMFLPRTLANDPAQVVILAAPEGSKRRPWHIQALATDDEDLFVIHANVDTGLSAAASFGGYGGSVSRPIDMAVSLIETPPSPRRPMLIGHIGDLEVKDVQGALVRDRMLYVASRGTKQLVIAAIEEPARQGISPSESIFVGEGVTGVAFTLEGNVQTMPAFDRYLTEVTVKKNARTKLFDYQHVVYGSNSLALRLFDERSPLRAQKKAWLGIGKYDPELALGQVLFHDALSFNISGGQIACATCHPDGREDGLVWRLGGTRRQTPLLAGRLEGTAPFNWEGTTASLEDNIAQTISRLGGGGLTKKNRHALARFIVEGLRRPTLAPAHDPTLIARGEKVFNDPAVGCSGCHEPTDHYVDHAKWDVESTTKDELAEMDKVNPPKVVMIRQPHSQKKTAKVLARKPQEYNTPSLKFVSLSAPYFHDGSSRSLDELIASNSDRMGQTMQLGADDKRALVAYLSSL